MAKQADKDHGKIWAIAIKDQNKKPIWNRVKSEWSWHKGINPDGEERLDSAKMFGSQPDTKMILDSAKRALKKALPHMIGNQRYT